MSQKTTYYAVMIRDEYVKSVNVSSGITMSKARVGEVPLDCLTTDKEKAGAIFSVIKGGKLPVKLVIHEFTNPSAISSYQPGGDD